MVVRISLALLVVLSMPHRLDAQRGIVGEVGPRWDVRKWFNLPRGAGALDVEDFRGKVLYLFTFQSWCPGCHSRGFPAFKKAVEHYKDNPDVAFVTVQTVFEGFHTNTAERARRTGRKYGLDIPIGHDPGVGGRRSNILQRYRTGGTPWSVVLDGAGVVRFSNFFLRPDAARSLIDRLVADLRSGRKLVGTKLEVPSAASWLSDRRAFGERALTVVRWAREGSKEDTASLKALQELAKQHGRSVGLTVVWAARECGTSDPAVVEAVRPLAGPAGLVRDDARRWLSQLRKAGARAAATSPTLLVDRKGIIRHAEMGARTGAALAASLDPEITRLLTR